MEACSDQDTWKKILISLISAPLWLLVIRENIMITVAFRHVVNCYCYEINNHHSLTDIIILI
jgi:hypothetical protein